MRDSKVNLTEEEVLSLFKSIADGTYDGKYSDKCLEEIVKKVCSYENNDDCSSGTRIIATLSARNVANTASFLMEGNGTLSSLQYSSNIKIAIAAAYDKEVKSLKSGSYTVFPPYTMASFVGSGFDETTFSWYGRLKSKFTFK